MGGGFPRTVGPQCVDASAGNARRAPGELASVGESQAGIVDAVSDSGRRAAVEGLSQFEQFRFALGTVMGKPDLVFDPPSESLYSVMRRR